MHNQILDGKFHHVLVVDSAVTLIGTHLLQVLDVANVIVAGTITDQ
jgi:hypothetical protein